MKRIRTRYIYLLEVILVALAIVLGFTEYAGWGGVCLIIVFFLSCVTKYRNYTEFNKKYPGSHGRSWHPWNY